MVIVKGKAALIRPPVILVLSSSIVKAGMGITAGLVVFSAI
jgi:hypothetical protein